MTILIEPAVGAGHFTSMWQGEVTGDEIIETHRQFYIGPAWRPGMKALTDLEFADLRQVSSEAMRRLADFTADFLISRNIRSMRSAIYAPRDLNYGLARVYEGHTERSPEEVRVFRDLGAARSWLGLDQSTEA